MMKTVTSREFFHCPTLSKSLHPGQSLIVTESGQPSFVVTRAGQRPRKTLADIEREARMVSHRKSPKVNYTKVMREMDPR